jgi:glucan 1,3-beta-glucosidase
MYQYQLSNADNIFMGFMQTESPYYQPQPLAPAPFTSGTTFSNDPTFPICLGSSACQRAWALRIINSTDIFIYGAGFYSFFQAYDQTCVNDGEENCQDALIDISFSTQLFIYDVATIGATIVISPEGGIPVAQADTQFFFTTVVIAYLGLSVEGGDQGGTGNDSPTAASIVPIPGCTTLSSPQATLTITSDCVIPIIQLPPSGANNDPPGPDQCPLLCDLFRQGSIGFQ